MASESTNESSSQGSLVESAPSRDRAFVKAFVETQMFEVWCDQMIGDVV